ncbi:MAG: serine hydrolase [Gaiellaceae bacterium]
MIDAPPLPPPVITAPAAYEVSFGLVAGTAPAGTRRVIVRVADRVVADRPLRGTRFSLRVDVPATVVSLRVTAVDGAGRRSSSSVGPVIGLPQGAAPRAVAPQLDAALSRTVVGLARGFQGTSGVYVQDLGTGRGAAWNAAARFPAASTLKLAIAVAVLRAQDGKPAYGSRVGELLRSMLVDSDNDAANALEVWLGGSTGAGSTRVNETMRALGLNDSKMYGGYERTTQRTAAPIPNRVESQPAFGVGKFTTAWDLARLARAIYLGSAGKGPLPALGVTPSEARHLLWLLEYVGDRGTKLDRYKAPNAWFSVLHKAGWLPTARHDNGIVYWRGGAFVAAVMTWNSNGVGSSADILAGRVALESFKRFR